VLDLVAGEGIGVSETEMIAGRLETELIRRGAFVVLERRRMDDILVEQGMQQSGACDTESCEVKMGQLLGVDKVLTGSLGKVGAVYSLNVKLLDVATGKILESQAVDVEGDLSRVLTEGCALLADQLSGSGTGTTASVVSLERNHKSWWIAGGVVLLTALGVGTYVLLQDDETKVIEIDRTLGSP